LDRFGARIVIESGLALPGKRLEGERIPFLFDMEDLPIDEILQLGADDRLLDSRLVLLLPLFHLLDYVVERIKGIDESPLFFTNLTELVVSDVAIIVSIQVLEDVAYLLAGKVYVKLVDDEGEVSETDEASGLQVKESKGNGYFLEPLVNLVGKHLQAVLDAHV